MDSSDAGLAWEILQRYGDPATAEFDSALAAAGLPDDVARALRFWQRESVANVKQYAAEVLPAVFGAVHAGQRDAIEATRKAGVLLAAQHRPVTEDRVIALPDATTGTMPEPPTEDLLEQRRRTVAARLAEFG